MPAAIEPLPPPILEPAAMPPSAARCSANTGLPFIDGHFAYRFHIAHAYTLLILRLAGAIDAAGVIGCAQALSSATAVSINTFFIAISIFIKTSIQL
jgi:hypothetical protein